jgi:hypothetical protein
LYRCRAEVRSKLLEKRNHALNVSLEENESTLSLMQGTLDVNYSLTSKKGKLSNLAGDVTIKRRE